MNFDSFNNNNKGEYGSFSYPTSVDPNEYYDLHHLFDDCNANVLQDGSYYDPTSFVAKAPLSSELNSPVDNFDRSNTMNLVYGNVDQSKMKGLMEQLPIIHHLNKGSSSSSPQSKAMTKLMEQLPTTSPMTIYSIDPLLGFANNSEQSGLKPDPCKFLYDQDPIDMRDKSMVGEEESDSTNKKSIVVKGQWTKEEDRLLTRLVEKFGVRRWSHIAEKLNGRVGKQCRERWHNHLRPNIKKDTWTEEEDKILVQAHSEIGNKWAEIAKRLPGRSENFIKNHWNATKRKQFSQRRRSQISKHANSGILHNYIKSLAPSSKEPPLMGSTGEHDAAVVLTSMPKNGPIESIAVNDTRNMKNDFSMTTYNLDEDENFLFDKKVTPEISDDMQFFKKLGCDTTISRAGGNKWFMMETECLDTAVPSLVTPTMSCEFNDDIDSFSELFP